MCMEKKRKNPRKGFTIPFLTRKQEREKNKKALLRKGREAVRVNRN